MQIRTTSSKAHRNMMFFQVFALVLVFFCQSSPAGALKNLETIQEIRSLRLGFGEYFIGHNLTEEQLAHAEKHRSDNSYQGTYKFQAGDIIVVASRIDNIILAVFKRRDDVGSQGLKRGVADAMNGFGEPTTMAHDKLIYWAYDQDGKITEKTFNRMKDKGELKVLATVKFNSSIPVAGATEEDREEDVDYYVMISSQPLLKKFLRQQ